MSGLKIMCPICTDDFVEADEIYSTTCGHMYHLSCMRQWQCRATSCPQCRSHNPQTHKVYLILNDANAEETLTAPSNVDEDIKVKLESSVDKIRELQAQVEECELNFYNLQEQYTVEQDLRKQFEQRIAQYNHNESNFLQLHAQYSESEDRVKLLQEENERLTIENDYKADELAIKASELSALKETLKSINIGNGESGISDLNAQCSESNDRIELLQLENKRLAIENEHKSKEIALNAKEIANLTEFRNAKNNERSDLIPKIKFDTLEQKYKHIAGELEKEISNRTQLAIEKIKLQSYIQRMELSANATKGLNNESSARPKHLVVWKKPNISNAPYRFPPQITHQNNQTNNTIILQKFPYKEIQYPLETVIVSLAAKMDISITNNDIKKTSMMDRGMPQNIPQLVVVFVEFKTNNLKLEFLSKKNLLRMDETFKSVYIKEYIDQQIHSLFLYANKTLRGAVFDHIACKNNTVIAKQKNSREEIIIYSRDQVDELLKNKSVLSTNEPSSPETADVIDECNYKI